jgi:hypothetical protein
MILFGGPVLSSGSRGLCSLSEPHLHMSRRTWHEALSCPVWIDSDVYMSGLGLFYLSDALGVKHLVAQFGLTLTST